MVETRHRLTIQMTIKTLIKSQAASYKIWGSLAAYKWR